MNRSIQYICMDSDGCGGRSCTLLTDDTPCLPSYCPFNPDTRVDWKPYEEGPEWDDHEKLVKRFKELDKLMTGIGDLMCPFVFDETFDPDAKFTPLEAQIRHIAHDHGIDWKREVQE